MEKGNRAQRGRLDW